MVKGEAVMPYAAQWYANERPAYSFYCVCGLAITGQSEKGLHTLIRKHKEKGIFHLEYTGEIVMPVPEGNITTSEILVPVVEEVVEDSTTEEAEDDLPELS
jgi:hypothetical protein